LIALSYAKPGRKTLYWLLAFFITAIGFMCFMQLDRIVKAQGRLMPSEGAFTVQPLNPQMIRKILVKVGQVVKKDQVLATCDPTYAAADLTALDEKVKALDAEVRRTQAEQAGVQYVPTANPYDATQKTLFDRRRTDFASGVADFDQKLAINATQIRQLSADIANFRDQLKIAQKLERMNAELEKPGYVSQVDFLNSQNAVLTINHNLQDAENGLISAQHLQASTVEQRKVFIDKWHETVLSEMVATQALLDDATQQMVKAQRTNDLVDLTSPEDAIVISIPKLNTNGVVQSAQPLFGLVPLNAPLEADLQIDSQDVGFVQVGDTVTIELDAFKFLEHGTVDAQVKTIGTDTLTTISGEDTVTGAAADTPRTPYFDARARIRAVNLHDIPPDFHLLPGMTFQADIIVGHRTIIWYLVGGALRSGSEAMHEP
jgi:HlyD family type I secretion membrane fusion protein